MTNSTSTKAVVKKTAKKQVKITSGQHAKMVEEVKELKKAVVEGRDAVILINVFSPGEEPKEFKVRIPKIRNNAPPPHCEAKYIAGLLIGTLKQRYGSKVK